MTGKLIEVANVFARDPDELKDNGSKLETAWRIARKVLDTGASGAKHWPALSGHLFSPFEEKANT